MERGQENCYLLTNGLGGFSSATVIGSNTRNDHALLMACTKAPNHRYNMIHRMEERIERQGKSVHLSSQEYLDKTKNEHGYRYLSSFSFEDYPVWVFHVDGVEITKTVAMQQGVNLAAVKYEIDNRTNDKIVFTAAPHLQFVPKGTGVERGREFIIEKDSIRCGAHTVYFASNGSLQRIPQRFVEGLYYAYDACDGRMQAGNTYVNHQIVKEAAPHTFETLEIVYSMDKTGVLEMLETEHSVDKIVASEKLENERSVDKVRMLADEVIWQAALYRKELVRISGIKQEAAQMLVKSAGQFVAGRASTGGKTILAGFPFFEDWGRDTMTAIAGCCITTKQFETAKSILRTFAVYCKDGLMPNLFPEGGNEPMYNTADAALLFIHAVYLYYEKTQDFGFVKEMYPVMEEIVTCYRKGTAFGIRMDEDGLLLAGQGMDQVTWMDVRIGDILPTPRHGKPVEINAYWYNALCVMDKLGRLLSAGQERDAGDYGTFAGQEQNTADCDILVGREQNAVDYSTPAEQKQNAGDYGILADKVKISFCEKFWNEEKGCLKDVLSGTSAENQIRCNQIWAVSMPFTMLNAKQEKMVVDTVFEKLYTPYGLRTLEKDDPEFHAAYGGPQSARDLAYHQGTVWVFPLGAYYLAYLKTRKFSKAAVDKVKRQLEVFESAMREGCIGQLAEIYDGENPSFSRGCFAQAWSVGEILRVYEALEEK